MTIRKILQLVLLNHARRIVAQDDVSERALSDLIDIMTYYGYECFDVTINPGGIHGIVDIWLVCSNGDCWIQIDTNTNEVYEA